MCRGGEKGFVDEVAYLAALSQRDHYRKLHADLEKRIAGPSKRFPREDDWWWISLLVWEVGAIIIGVLGMTGVLS